MLTSADIKAEAARLGFDLCGVAPADVFPELGRYADWLARGYAGEMTYLHKSAQTRADIRAFLPSARSVIVTGTIYNTRQPEGARANRASDAVRVARYARGRDYHVVLAERLQLLEQWMHREHGEPFEASTFVDKHHVQERAYAARAGIGWIGRNTCLIHPETGSWLLLGGMATSLNLQADAPLLDQCGDCTLCLDACPTGALVEPRLLDATRCLSYLTIELQGPVPSARRAAVADHVFGCDVCQEVCPWNQAAPFTADAVWFGPPVRDGARAAELWQRTDEELHAFVRGSAMTHASLARLRRNLALVIGNSGEPALAAVLDRPGHGVKNAAHSAETPLVRDAVAWARTRLAESKRHGGRAPRDSRSGVG